MKIILSIIFAILGLLLLVIISAGALVMSAYGLGWLLTRFLPFSPFEATILSLAALCISILVVFRFVAAFITPPFKRPEEELDEDWEDEDWDEEDWDEEDWEDEDWDEDDEDETEVDQFPGIPKWRQPLKKLDFSNVKPDDRCPCGSGRKYKNCHGTKAKS